MNAIIIDISEHKGVIDFERMRQAYDAGLLHAVYVRASCAGTRSVFQDALFKRNWAELKRCAIPRGAYVYYSPAYTAREQAAHFVRALTGIQNIGIPLNYEYFERKLGQYWQENNDFGDLPPMIDFETTGPYDPFADNGRMRDMLKEMIHWVETWTRTVPGIYTSPGFWKPFEPILSKSLGYYPLWLALYTQDGTPNPSVLKKQVPYPWWDNAEFQPPGSGGWTLWQYTKNGDGVPFGIEKWSSALDMSVFNGTPNQFRDWLHGYGIPVPVKPAALPVTPAAEEPIPAGEGELYRTRCNMFVRSAPDLALSARSALFYRGSLVEVSGDPLEAVGYVWLPVFKRYYIAFKTLSGSQVFLEKAA